MIRVEHTVEIARPADEVFEYLTDLEHLPEWQASAIEMRPEGALAKGTRIREVRKFLGRRVESTLEVTEHEPPRRFSLRVLEGPVRYEIEHQLEDVAGRTRLTFVGRGEAGGFFRLAERAIVKAAERQFVNDLETLRDVLESR